MIILKKKIDIIFIKMMGVNKKYKFIFLFKKNKRREKERERNPNQLKRVKISPLV